MYVSNGCTCNYNSILELKFIINFIVTEKDNLLVEGVHPKLMETPDCTTAQR